MKALRWLVGIGTLLIAAGGFTLSFGKLHWIGLACGYGGNAWIYPAIVEGFVTLCTLAAFLRHGQRGAWYPWTVGIAGFAYSLWANAVPESVPVEIARSVPVICIPLSVHMFIIIAGLVDRAASKKVEAVKEATREEFPEFFTDVTPQDFTAPPVVELTEQERRILGHVDQADPEPEVVAEPEPEPVRARGALASADTYRKLAAQAKTPEKKAEWNRMADVAAALS